VNARDGISTAHHHVFSKGIHVIVDRLTAHRRVLTFFADDGRLFFVIPMQAKTCIGTTDTRVERPEVEVTPDDRRFVLDNINKRLRLARPLGDGDVIAERCGVRPLVVSGTGNGARDWTQLSRKHAIETDVPRRRLTIFGGKLTDCINVGDEICAEAQRLGDPRQAEVIIETSEYIRCELDEAARREMVVKLEDFLRRRSKIAQVVREEEIRAAPGLREACRILFGAEAEEKIAEYFAPERAFPPSRKRPATA
ncbi:MAG: FAD-dependent oxidoreductase, partial [Deltaproteobacteria bacterium]